MIRTFSRYIVPLHKGGFDRGLTAIMAFMVALAVLFTAGAITLSDFINDWSRGIENSISVSALYPDDMRTQTQQKITDKISRILNDTEGVKSANIVPDADKQQLLSHWLGDAIDKNTIDLPVLWDVTVDNGFDVSAVTTAIQAIYDGAVIDDYMHWKNSLLQFASDMIFIAYAFAVVVVCVLVVLISLCVRILVALHMETLQVLTLLGASDSFILKDVGRYAFWVGLKSAFFGVIVSVAGVVIGGLWYTDMTFAILLDFDRDMLQQIFLANMLRIFGLCAIILAVALISRWGAIRSAKKCIRQHYRI